MPASKQSLSALNKESCEVRDSMRLCGLKGEILYVFRHLDICLHCLVILKSIFFGFRLVFFLKYVLMVTFMVMVSQWMISLSIVHLFSLCWVWIPHRGTQMMGQISWGSGFSIHCSLVGNFFIIIILHMYRAQGPACCRLLLQLLCGLCKWETKCIETVGKSQAIATLDINRL